MGVVRRAQPRREQALPATQIQNSRSRLQQSPLQYALEGWIAGELAARKAVGKSTDLAIRFAGCRQQRGLRGGYRDQGVAGPIPRISPRRLLAASGCSGPSTRSEP